jgi:hypothetical protein
MLLVLILPIMTTTTRILMIFIVLNLYASWSDSAAANSLMVGPYFVPNMKNSCAKEENLLSLSLSLSLPLPPLVQLVQQSNQEQGTRTL